MAEKKVLTVRVSAEPQDRLDAIAEIIDRPRSWVVNRALEAFVESEAWQIEEIKRGLAEADAGEFASDAEVGAMFEKWRRLAGMMIKVAQSGVQPSNPHRDSKYPN